MSFSFAFEIDQDSIDNEIANEVSGLSLGRSSTRAEAEDPLHTQTQPFQNIPLETLVS